MSFIHAYIGDGVISFWKIRYSKKSAQFRHSASSKSHGIIQLRATLVSNWYTVREPGAHAPLAALVHVIEQDQDAA